MFEVGDYIQKESDLINGNVNKDKRHLLVLDIVPDLVDGGEQYLVVPCSPEFGNCKSAHLSFEKAHKNYKKIH